MFMHEISLNVQKNSICKHLADSNMLQKTLQMQWVGCRFAGNTCKWSL